MDKVATGRGQIRMLAAAVEAMRRLREWNRRRQMMVACGPLSADLLRDIGLTPEDLDAARGLPLHRDASEQLRREAAVQAANW